MPLRRIKIETLTEAPDIRRRTPLSNYPEIAAMWHKTKKLRFQTKPVFGWLQYRSLV